MKPIAVAWCVLLGVGGFAQSFRALLDTTATWQDSFHLHFFPPGPSTFECYRYYLQGDTLVNDTAYRTLRKTGVFSSNAGAEEWFSGTITAFLREDTASGKVFLRDPTWQQEQLMYDFSAELGPYPWTSVLPTADMIVTLVDTIELPDGAHRRITLDGYLEIIEGVGAITGFIGTQSSANLGWGGLVCKTVAGVEYYQGTSDPDCTCGSNVGISSEASSGLRIGPSPTTDLCLVDGATPNASFQIRSVEGRILQSGNCSSNGSAAITMSGLPAALYLVHMLDGARPVVVRIIKE